ncbi:MAG TPA: MFS transporter [Bradyrhizobium sp.]|nr:MFS transporter [Bradyrhizobium sp.]
MTSVSAPAKSTWREALTVYSKPRVLIVLFLGFSAGLPLALSGATLLVWMSEAGVDLGTIGLFTLVGTPYTIKFLWAPVVDAIEVPLLTRWLGRRRGWLVLSQLMLMVAILLLALSNPQYTPLAVVVCAALLVATASATQDILIDAFRVESLDEREQAAGMASYVAAYRIATVFSTAGVLYLVSGFEWLGAAKDAAWSLGYAVMAGLIGIGLITTLIATEPERSADISDEDWQAQKPDTGTVYLGPSWISRYLRRPVTSVLNTRIGIAAYTSFSEFLHHRLAVAALIFVILYKLCDAFAGAMTAPFIIKGLGFDRLDYANIVKGVGLAATLIGGFAGGFIARAYPLVTCLWIGAILQMASNVVFTWLAYVGLNHWALTAAIIAENFTGMIGTVIFVAYLSALCQSPLHTATQFALLTALAAFGRTYLSAGAGFVADAAGWPMFFVISSLVAIPSLVLLWWLQMRGHFDRLVPART